VNLFEMRTAELVRTIRRLSTRLARQTMRGGDSDALATLRVQLDDCIAEWGHRDLGALPLEVRLRQTGLARRRTHPQRTHNH